LFLLQSAVSGEREEEDENRTQLSRKWTLALSGGDRGGDAVSGDDVTDVAIVGGGGGDCLECVCLTCRAYLMPHALHNLSFVPESVESV
jgi:hypothetical protein